jgi:biopolymer transport protein ExbB/TolQ
MGIVASVLLFFAGDIATAVFSSSGVVALFIAIGYVLWMVWFLLVSQKLYQLGRAYRKAGRNKNEIKQQPGKRNSLETPRISLALTLLFDGATALLKEIHETQNTKKYKLKARAWYPPGLPFNMCF